jgi:hypothetical protein
MMALPHVDEFAGELRFLPTRTTDASRFAAPPPRLIERPKR